MFKSKDEASKNDVSSTANTNQDLPMMNYTQATFGFKKVLEEQNDAEVTELVHDRRHGYDEE